MGLLLWLVMCIASDDPRAVATVLAERLEASYVDEAAGKAIAADLRSRAAAGEFDRLAGESLAQSLNARIRAVTADPHLGVRFSAEPVADAESAEPTPEERERMRHFAAAQNFGFEKLERLPGNVGFMELNGFADPQFAGDTAVAAMAFLGNADALIIDLRYNSGGMPGIGMLLCSYLFDRPVHLHLSEWRENAGTRVEQFWTQAYVPGRRLAHQPVFILTSERTISAAESFAYGLQAIGRARIVGEVTAGGGHAGAEVRIAEHFAAFIPTGRAVNPITKANWEGSGIQPDVVVDEEQAAAAEHRIALEALGDAADDESTRAEYQDALDQLSKSGRTGGGAPPRASSSASASRSPRRC